MSRAGVPQRGHAKMSHLPKPIRPLPTTAPLRKPPWLRVRIAGGERAARVRELLRAGALHTVCEEASCPNLPECFSRGTATFMILGALCTRRCPFCDVAHGRPLPPDPGEPHRLAEGVARMGLSYVVITSVDRDDLRDAGASHFSACIRALRQRCPSLGIEILVPDFKKRVPRALEQLAQALPDVFNHNLETVPRIYKTVRPGADYAGSLALLRAFKHRHPEIPTKSGLMLGLGERTEEVMTVLEDLRAHDCDMLTLGQYLQPSRYHLPVQRYVPPEEFERLAECARSLGFSNVASGPLVRSSYHADRQAGALSA